MNGMTDGTHTDGDDAVSVVAYHLSRHQAIPVPLSGNQAGQTAIRCNCKQWFMQPTMDLDIELSHQLHQAACVTAALTDALRLTPEGGQAKITAGHGVTTHGWERIRIRYPNGAVYYGPWYRQA